MLNHATDSIRSRNEDGSLNDSSITSSSNDLRSAKFSALTAQTVSLTSQNKDELKANMPDSLAEPKRANLRKLSDSEKRVIDSAGFILGCDLTATIMGCNIFQVLGGAIITRLVGSSLATLCANCISYFTGAEYSDPASATSRVLHPLPMTAAILGLVAAGLAESMAFILVTDFAIPAFQQGRPDSAAMICGLSILALGISRAARYIAWSPKTKHIQINEERIFP